MSPMVPVRLRLRGKLTWFEVDAIPVSCPYCGHEWMYTGGDKHYATCPGMRKGVFDSGNPWTYPCNRKVRLHGYLIRTSKRPMNKLIYPNENYVRWWELEETSNEEKG